MNRIVMTIFALGFATMLLALQVYSFSQPKGKKVPIWKAVVFSLGWPITLACFFLKMAFSGKSLKEMCKEALKHLRKPIG